VATYCVTCRKRRTPRLARTPRSKRRGDVKREANGAGYCVVAAATTYAAGWPATPPPSLNVVLLCANSKETTHVPRVKPTRCDSLGPGQAFSQGRNLANLHWHGWGEAEATATGVELGYHRPAVDVPAGFELTDCGRATKTKRGTRAFASIAATARAS
jgi:hypothetical protein